MKATHLIQKVEFDIKVPDKKSGEWVYDSVHSEFNRFLIAFDQKLQEILVDDTCFRIDTIELSLGIIKPDEIFSTLEKNLLEKIKRLIDAARKNPARYTDEIASVGFVDSVQEVLSIFEAFLKEGSFPWNAPFATLKELEEQVIILIEKGMIIPIWEIISSGRMEIYRFVHQFSGPFLHTVLHAFLSDHSDGPIPDEILKGRAFIKSGMDQIKTDDWYWMFKTLAKVYESDVDSFVASIGGILNMDRPKEDIIPLDFFYKDAVSKFKKDKLEPLFEREHYVKNSGMIILHPYLERFFTHFNLLEKKLFNDAINHATAVYLLHYLATGDLTPEEHELVFPKMILGYPLHLPIPKDLSLPENFETESSTLLKAVIRNWSVLKNTSVDGLRESFFHREGKVIETEISYKLIVEKKGVDVLLQHLPWALSVIAFPWLRKPIFVEWS